MRDACTWNQIALVETTHFAHAHHDGHWCTKECSNHRVHHGAHKLGHLHCNLQLNSNVPHWTDGIDPKIPLSNTMLCQSCIRGATSSLDHVQEKEFVSAALMGVPEMLFTLLHHTLSARSTKIGWACPPPHTHTTMQLFTSNKRNICTQSLYSSLQSGWNQIINDNRNGNFWHLLREKYA